MSANIIPFPKEELALNERWAARRAYRKGLKIVVEKAVCQAFMAACKIPGTQGLGVDDAFLLFVAAMRRELRRSGLF